MNVQKKYSMGIPLLLAVIVALFIWQNVNLYKNQVKADYKEAVYLLTEVTENALRIRMLEGRAEEFQKFLETLVAGDVEAVRIFSEDGSILNSSMPGELGKRLHEEDLAFYRRLEGSAVSVFEREGREKYVRVVRIDNETLCQRCHRPGETTRGFLQIEISPQKADITHVGNRGLIMLSSALFLLIIFIIVLLTSRYMIRRPVAELLSSLENSEETNYTSRISPAGKDEIGILASRINQLLSELETARNELDKYRADEMRYIKRMASIGEVAAVVAHEIKNPLAGISGALQVLAEDFPTESPRREIANDVLHEIVRLDAAVKDLLLFANPPEPSLILTDIHAIIKKVIHSVSLSANGQRVKINSVLGTIPEIMADPEQLERAFLNIVQNGIRAMPDGGTLSIAVSHRPQSDEIGIAFSDTGKGLTEENLKDVFSPLILTKRFGTGLGLAISRNIIESHKGRITVESRVDVGSTFHIILPVKR